LTSLTSLDMSKNTFTDIKGFENLTNLSYITLSPKITIRKCFLNGKEIPLKVAGIMGFDINNRYTFRSVIARQMVKYCQFLKEMGYLDSNTPGIVKAYRKWDKLHRT